MAKLVAAKCPNCGAALKIPPLAERVTCSYCQTSSFIQRGRTSTAEPPPAAAGSPVIRLEDSASSSWRVVLGVIAVAALGGGYLWYRNAQTLGDVAFQGAPLLFDVNGDGVEDVIMSSTDTGTGNVRLRALEATSGSVLWTSDELGDVLSDDLALVGDTVILIGTSKFRGFHARSGEQRFSRALPERVEVVCESEDGWFLVTEDKAVHVIDPRSGLLSPASDTILVRNTSSRPACTPAWNSGMSSHGRLVRDESRPIDMGIQSMRVYKMLVYGDEQPAFALGQRNEGSAIPVVAGVRDGQVQWQQELPGTNPLEAKDEEATGATVAAARAYATYERAEAKGFALAAFVLSDGNRVWETFVPQPQDPRSVHLAASEKTVFAHARSALFGFSAADGRVLWSRGYGVKH